ncbi:MAG: GAF domain-containing protein, partial [Actinomycetota bacterium]|nr:GAF domain-containing protein [Actinomycetota bacterium]
MGQIITGAVIIFNLVLGAAVWLNNKKKPVNIVFSLFVLAVVGWTISNFLADATKTFAGALFWVRASFAFAGLFGALLLLFVYFFTQPPERQIKNSFLTAVAAGAVFMFGFSFTPWLVKTVELKSWGANTINGPYFLVWVAYFLGNVIAAIRKLVVRYRTVKGPQRRQIQYLFFGVAVSFGFGVTIDLFIPLVTGSTDLAKYSPFGTALFLFITSLAIIQHRLLDIRLLVLKSVAYSVSFGLLIAGYVSLTYLVFQAFHLAVSRTLIDLVIFFVLIFTFNPLRLFIERHTDRLFFKNRYDFNNLLGQLSDITKRHSRTINTLTNELLMTIAREMRISRAALVLAMSSQFAQVRTVGFKHRPDQSWGPLMRVAIEVPGTVSIDDLADGSDEKGTMRRDGVETIVPIRTEDATIAALVLGEKKSGDPFNDEDLRLFELIAPQIALALENAASFIERGQRIAELQSINKMFRHIEHFLDLDKLLQEIVDEAIMVTRADGGSIMLTADDGRTLTVKTARNLNSPVSLNAKVRAGEGIAGTVAKTLQPLIVNGSEDVAFQSDLKREGIASVISVPMIVEDKLVGVLNINRKKHRAEFSEENLTIMSAFAAQAAEAIMKAGHYREIEKLSLQNDTQFREFIKALSKTVDAKDPYTYGHSEVVTSYSMEVAAELGLSGEETRSIEIGGRLHDMGKIGVPENILNKPGKLTEEAFASVRRHPEIAADILKDTESLKDIR